MPATASDANPVRWTEGQEAPSCVIVLENDCGAMNCVTCKQPIEGLRLGREDIPIIHRLLASQVEGLRLYLREGSIN
jgi:hypothetical protein